jgi:branched-chain amino acid aminotransferase
MDVVEEALPVQKVLKEAVECFVTGTAAGITPLGSLTHEGRTEQFSSLYEDSVSVSLLKELKSIQYGAAEDKFGWMFAVHD